MALKLQTQQMETKTRDNWYEAGQLEPDLSLSKFSPEEWAATRAEKMANNYPRDPISGLKCSDPPLTTAG
jgi:hypothetical protein